MMYPREDHPDEDYAAWMGWECDDEALTYERSRTVEPQDSGTESGVVLHPPTPDQ